MVIQLCLAISGLALQVPAWERVVETLIDSFGRNPATVPTLLEFLTLLPEEVSGNTRIPISVCRIVLYGFTVDGSFDCGFVGQRVSGEIRSVAYTKCAEGVGIVVDVYSSEW